MPDSTAPPALPLAVPDPLRDRYAALGLLPWWKQDKVRAATVLVVGAGAVGNEVIKNLALVGVGRLLIVDLDAVEASNLTRSVLFRAADRGRKKAEVAARAARRINPDVATAWIEGDVRSDLGGGVWRRVDVVVACVDSREARLAINRACYRAGKPWVDGALHELHGEARLFWPGRGACYECTLVAADYEAINRRYSCAALARDLSLEGRIATTPTVASIIGGIEVQEVLKLLHGLPVAPGQGTVWNGLTNESYTVVYPRRSGCLGHQSQGPITECPALGARSTTLRELLARIRAEMGERAVLELDFDLLLRFECRRGHASDEILRPLVRVRESAAVCPACGTVRWPLATHVIDGSEPFADKTLAEIGIPPLSILCGRAGATRRHFELTRDARALFGRRAAQREKENHGQPARRHPGSHPEQEDLR
jgi:molybdopterin/thiamine biosynthesis adenylyltransferase